LNQIFTDGRRFCLGGEKKRAGDGQGQLLVGKI